MSDRFSRSSPSAAPPVPGSDPAAVVESIDRRSRRHEVPCGEGRMVWRSWGAGPPLVLLHGASGSWTHWLRNVLPLAERFTVLAPDMPGFGDSDLPPGDHSADRLADLVSSALDAVVPPPARLDLAGFSLGGIIAGLVAARQGARLRRLVLVGPNGMALPFGPVPVLSRPVPGMTAAELTELHRDNLRVLMIGDPARADDLAAHLQMSNVRRARFRSGQIPASDALLRALPAVRARIAGIWGSRDAFAFSDIEARRRVLARFQPGFDFRVIEGAGHWVPYEASAEVNAALLDILDGGPPAARR